MEPIECSETSAFKPQTPGKYPKENILHKEHGESLKSRQYNSYSIQQENINPLNAKLNPICHLLALLGTPHIFHVSGLRIKHV
jgi:hypothetical protein